MNDDDILCTKACKDYIFALREYIFAGADEITQTISAKNGWEFTVTMKVTKRGAPIGEEKEGGE